MSTAATFAVSTFAPPPARPEIRSGLQPNTAARAKRCVKAVRAAATIGPRSRAANTSGKSKVSGARRIPPGPGDGGAGRGAGRGGGAGSAGRASGGGAGAGASAWAGAGAAGRGGGGGARGAGGGGRLADAGSAGRGIASGIQREGGESSSHEMNSSSSREPVGIGGVTGTGAQGGVAGRSGIRASDLEAAAPVAFGAGRSGESGKKSGGGGGPGGRANARGGMRESFSARIA